MQYLPEAFVLPSAGASDPAQVGGGGAGGGRGLPQATHPLAAGHQVSGGNRTDEENVLDQCECNQENHDGHKVKSFRELMNEQHNLKTHKVIRRNS